MIPKHFAAVLAALLVAVATTNAQTFTTLHSFTATSGSSSTNGDGANPTCSLLLSGSTLYGTTIGGGTNGNGTVFAVNTDGTGFRILHNFTTIARDANSNATNSDGLNPHGGLVLSGGTLYGVARNGGLYGSGTIFAVNTNGTGFTNLYYFSEIYPIYNDDYNGDGAFPSASLILSGNTLYGSTVIGGNFAGGTVFAVKTNGTGFTTLNSLDTDSSALDGLVLSGPNLYGTTIGDGGNDPTGTIFALNTNGFGFTNLYVFPFASGYETNGASIQAGLLLLGNTLYGTASIGGYGGGTIFGINTNGAGFTVLHKFSAGAYNSSNVYIYPDGFAPYSSLVSSGNTLYGTTQQGGSSSGSIYYYGNFNAFSIIGYGTVFAVNADGTGFKVLYNFAGGTNGANPQAGMILSGNTLYGTTTGTVDGTNGYGTVFSLTLPPPQLNITLSKTNVVLSWPTNAPGFTLLSATNLNSSAIWNTVLPVPTIQGGQNVVTNSVSKGQRFYRLQSN